MYWPRVFIPDFLDNVVHEIPQSEASILQQRILPWLLAIWLQSRVKPWVGGMCNNWWKINYKNELKTIKEILKCKWHSKGLYIYNKFRITNQKLESQWLTSIANFFSCRRVFRTCQTSKAECFTKILNYFLKKVPSWMLNIVPNMSTS